MLNAGIIAEPFGNGMRGVKLWALLSEVLKLSPPQIVRGVFCPTPSKIGGSRVDHTHAVSFVYPGLSPVD